MAAVTALTLKTSADRSMSVTFTSAAKADTLTFAALSALLPSGSSTIKSFLDATRGSVALTLAALGDNGVVISYASTVADSGSVQVSADKTFAGFAAGDCVLRIALAASISA
jgi:hypothetical protein